MNSLVPQYPHFGSASMHSVLASFYDSVFSTVNIINVILMVDVEDIMFTPFLKSGVSS